jgi:hypothetical protein
MTSNFDRLRAKLDADKHPDVMQAQPSGPHHTHTCCGICHAYVGDVKQHSDWHRNQQRRFQRRPGTRKGDLSE